MRLPLTDEFLDEAARFDLRFCCEDCAHFDEKREICRHEWPTEAHRERRYEAPVSVADVVFCKEFDLA